MVVIAHAPAKFRAEESFNRHVELIQLFSSTMLRTTRLYAVISMAAIIFTLSITWWDRYLYSLSTVNFAE